MQGEQLTVIQALQLDSHEVIIVWRSCRGYKLIVRQGLQADSHTVTICSLTVRTCYRLTFRQGSQLGSHAGATVWQSYARFPGWHLYKSSKLTVMQMATSWKSCKDSSFPVMQGLQRHGTTVRQARLSLSGTKLVIMFDKQSTAYIFISAYQSDINYLWIVSDWSQCLLACLEKLRKWLIPSRLNWCCDWFDIC
jgi:hypothetical protein